MPATSDRPQMQTRHIMRQNALLLSRSGPIPYGILRQQSWRKNDINCVNQQIGTLLAEIALTRSDNLIFFLEVLGARSLTECKAPSIQRTTQCPQTELLIRSFLRKPFSYHLKRNVRALSVRLTYIVPGHCLQRVRYGSGRTASTLRCAPVQHIWASVKVRHDPFHRCYPYS